VIYRGDDHRRLGVTGVIYGSSGDQSSWELSATFKNVRARGGERLGDIKN